MKDTQHTPGPWKALISRWPNGEMNGQPYIYAPNGPDTKRHVAEVFGESDDTFVEANAKLIAAAPDLLAACKLMREWHSKLLCGCDDTDALRSIMADTQPYDDHGTPATTILCAAIAKAEGK